MSEHSQRTFAICGTVLIVGLVFSSVLWVSLMKFNDSLTKVNNSFRLKDFYERNPISANAYQTIRLNDGQFVVVS